MGLAFNSITNQLFVCEYYNHRIQVFSIAKSTSSSRMDFKFQYKIGSNGTSNGQFNLPVGIRIRYKKQNPTLNDDFELFVADHRNRVQVLNGKTGEWIRNIGEGKVNDPTDIEIHGNEIYVLEYVSGGISAFNVDDGKFIHYVCNNGNGPNDNQLNYPWAFKVFNNQLFVADSDNHKMDHPFHKFCYDSFCFHTKIALTFIFKIFTILSFLLSLFSNDIRICLKIRLIKKDKMKKPN